MFMSGDMFSVVFLLMSIVIFCVFFIVLAKNISEWNKNNHSPKLTVPATVVSKRSHTSHHDTTNGHSSSTTYYVTFQVESGDRMELHLNGHEYGMLCEGDRGMLSFQGTRYLNFERQ